MTAVPQQDSRETAVAQEVKMFGIDVDEFKLTDLENKLSLKNSAMVGLYLLLAIVVLVTGTHAVMLVLSQAPEFVGDNGLVSAVLDVVRVAFPVTMELAAVVAGLGFIAARWRKGQKAAAAGIELVWIVFAAANMITFFRVERGLPLESWQVGWINYGLPLTSLVAGVLAYSLTRRDPDLKRKDEASAADEKIAMIQFAARRDVAISAQRVAIERQRAWVDFVKGLRSQGYTDLQLRFMLQDTPELMVDGDQDGRMDLLEDGVIEGEGSPVAAAANGDGPEVHEVEVDRGSPPPIPVAAPPDAVWCFLEGEWKLMRPAVPLNGDGEPDGQEAQDLTVDEVMAGFGDVDERGVHRQAAKLLLGGAGWQAVERDIASRYGHIPKPGRLSIIRAVDGQIKAIRHGRSLQAEAAAASETYQNAPNGETDPK